MESDSKGMPAQPCPCINCQLPSLSTCSWTTATPAPPDGVVAAIGIYSYSGEHLAADTRKTRKLLVASPGDLSAELWCSVTA